VVMVKRDRKAWKAQANEQSHTNTKAACDCSEQSHAAFVFVCDCSLYTVYIKSLKYMQSR
jgi:hypothetical protein